MSDERRIDEKRYLLRLPHELAEDVHSLAGEHERSFNAEIVWALRRYVRHVRQENQDEQA